MTDQQEQRKRRQLLDRIDREIIRDLLSIITLNMTLETGDKHSRSEALREVLLDYYKDKPEVKQAILAADSRRERKTKELDK